MSLITELINSILPREAPPDSTPSTRMMSPDGTLCAVPVYNVEAAEAEGWRVMTDEDMAALLNRQEITRRFFEKDWAKTHKPLKLKRGWGRW